MSVTSWVQEFYNPACELSIKEALQCDLLKWTGLRQEALNRHAVRCDDHLVYSDYDYFSIGRDTCHLCQQTRSCKECPIYQCSGTCCSIEFTKAVEHANPEPMIELLQTVITLLNESQD